MHGSVIACEHCVGENLMQNDQTQGGISGWPSLVLSGSCCCNWCGGGVAVVWRWCGGGAAVVRLTHFAL